MKRERLSSRLGFILLSAGCAIGIGNVWKFPWMVGQNGGATFVLIYLICLIAIGVPVMTMEFALGRASQKSVVKLYQGLEKEGHRWHIHGYAALIANIILMMFYSVVCAWMVKYFVDIAAGDFANLSAQGISKKYDEMLANPLELMIYTAIIVFAGFFVCSKGVANGLEKVTKFMMLALLGIMLILAVNSCFLPGAEKGIRFYLVPNTDAVRDIGILNVIVSAMNQSFFTLSVGIGSMAIFGSYINRDRALMGEALNVAVLDTFVALCSGLIIFPACFAYGVDVDNGPSLIFITLPNIFNNIPLGRLWGTLFFVFLTFAAFSTVLAVYENIISCVMDISGLARKKVCLICSIAMFVLTLPCILGFNVLSDVNIMGKGIMDMEDYAVSNLMLPLGSLCFAMFCVLRYGWGWDKFVEEANQGKGLKVQKWMRPYMTFVLPIIIIVIFLGGILK